MDNLDRLFDSRRKPWPHQSFGVAEAIKAIEAREHSCVTSPTGGGKTDMMIALIRWCASTHRKVLLYANRKMLIDQTIKVLDDSGINYGVIAAGHKDKRATLRDVQIASIQTVHSRVKRLKKQEHWHADVTIVDEAHLLGNGVNLQILTDHSDAGSTLIGFTATPLGISHIYPHLIIAGRNSTCRQCGALVPATVYAPSEMDTSKLKLQDSGDFNYEEIKQIYAGARHAIFGHVFDHWKQINPDALPAIGFAPGVAESKWLVDQFAERGVRCAHIDGEDCYIDGEEVASSKEVRDEILAESKAGRVAVLWNRFICREGINAPWLYHAILATPFGSLMSYIQSVGRILRRSDATPDRVIISDHGGNHWRHVSPNADFDWDQWYFEQPSLFTRVRMDAIRERREPTPIACEFCGVVRNGGILCPNCHRQMNKKRRMIIQKDGKLKPVFGEPLPKKYVREKNDTYMKWKSMYHRGVNADMSFAQAVGLFVHENGYWPPTDLPMMPKHPIRMFSKIRAVPHDQLVSVQEHVLGRESSGKDPVHGAVQQYEQGKLF